MRPIRPEDQAEPLPSSPGNPLDAGVKSPGVRIAVAEPGVETIANESFGRWLAGVLALTSDIDEAEREYGPDVYKAILKDAIAGASFDTLRQGVLADCLRVRPAVEPEAGAEPDPRAARAAEVAAFCDRALKRTRRCDVDWLNEMLLGMAEGSRLGEIVLEHVQHGPDAGKLQLRAVKPKPRGCWRFVCDAYGNVHAIAGRLPPGQQPPDEASAAGVVGGEGQSVLLPRERFAIFTWDARDGDPRGHSHLRRVYNPWNLKVRTWPDKHAHDVRFGSPAVYAVLSETAEDPEPGLKDPATGEEIRTAEQATLLSLRRLRGGAAAVFPFGTEVNILESQRDGKTLNDSVELYNREMVHGVLGQTRSTMEAEHGSKADSKSGTDTRGLLIRLIRALLAAVVRNDVLRYLVAVNFGEADAEEYLPCVGFGDVEHQDRPALMAAVAALAKVGFFTEGQLAALDQMLGLPVRKPGEERMQVGPAPAEGDGEGEGDDKPEGKDGP